MSDKKRKLDLKTQFKKLCTRLSPNNIVFDILAYYMFYFYQPTIVHGKCWEDFDGYRPGDLFGYFKLDRLRNIWMIFRCVNLFGCGFVSVKTTIYMNPMKIHFLSLAWDQKLFQKSKRSRKFTNLITLQIITSKYNWVVRMNWELFPNLKYLSFGADSPLSVHLLRNCPFKQLKGFELREFCGKLNYVMDKDFDYLIKQNFENLENLSFCDCTVNDEFFIKQSFPVLKWLKIKENARIQGKWKSYNLEWIKNLKGLRIIDCDGITDKFFEMNSFPKLKFLYIRQCDNLTYIHKTWNRFPKLEILNIDHCRSICNNIIECCLHQNSNFPKLRKLIIKECESVRFSSRLGLLNNIPKNLSKTIERISIIQCGDDQSTSITWPIPTSEEKKHF